MKVLLLCLFLSTSVFAKGVLLSIGPSGVSEYESDKEASNGKKLLDAKGTLGYNVGIEFPILNNFLSFNMNGLYARSEAKTQYFDKLTSIQAVDQESLISNSEVLAGLRIRPLNFKYLKVFIGGGGLLGNAKLRHDTDDYIERHGSLPAGFKDVEKVKKWGHFIEAGTEIGLSKNGGIRLMGQLVSSQTEKFRTLNHKDIKGTYSVYTIQYMHYFEIKK